VRQKLAASQALAEGLKRKAAIADMSMEQVVDYFYKVFNTAQFIASDRDRCVLTQGLLSARARCSLLRAPTHQNWEHLCN
jgi:hypothetical protein